MIFSFVSIFVAEISAIEIGVQKKGHHLCLIPIVILHIFHIHQKIFTLKIGSLYRILVHSVNFLLLYISFMPDIETPILLSQRPFQSVKMIICHYDFVRYRRRRYLGSV